MDQFRRTNLSCNLNRIIGSRLFVALILLVLSGCISIVEPPIERDIPVPTSAIPQIQHTSTPNLPTSPPIAADPPDVTLPEGEISSFQDTFGLYFLYRPTTPADPPQTLVVIHGTPGKGHSMLGRLPYCQNALIGE